MNIEKLKALDQSLIQDERIKTQINDAISTFDGIEDLNASEQAAIDKVYNRAAKHISDNDQQTILKKQQEEEALKNAEAEEKEKKASAVISALVLPHKEYLKETGLSLPAGMKQREVIIATQMAKLKKNPDNENIKQSILNLSQKLKTDIMSKEQDDANAKAAAEAKIKADADAAAAKAKEEADAKVKTDGDAAEKAKQEAEKAEAAKIEEEGAYGNSYYKSRFGS
jgi:hypothetical protein